MCVVMRLWGYGDIGIFKYLQVPGDERRDVLCTPRMYPLGRY